MESLILIMAMDMPISNVASLLGLDDGRVWRVVDCYVTKAREKEDYSNIRAVGFDETSSRRGHNYITIAVDLETSKVIFASEGKDHTTIDSFTDDFVSHLGKVENITDVCSDLSKAYIKGVQDNFPNAVHTYDKFHIMKMVGEAIDFVRKEEQRFDPILQKTRYLWLKNRSSLSSGEVIRFDELSKMNLKTARAYRMKEALKVIWDCLDIESAIKVFNKWYFWATHSRIEPIIRLAKALKRHQSGILNIVKSRISNGIVEAINGKIQMLKRSGRGYPNIDNFITMVYLRCGKLSLNLPT
jgi:transposase